MTLVGSLGEIGNERRDRSRDKKSDDAGPDSGLQRAEYDDYGNTVRWKCPSSMATS